MRVAVLRAAADAVRTADRLSELGHTAIVAPVIEIVATGEPLPADACDALIFTSAHAVEAVANDRRLPFLFSRPCYCVGARTESCARALGFTDVRSARADAKRLAALIASEIPVAARLRFVGGRDRKPILEQTLTGLGYRVSASEVYAAMPYSWSEMAVTAFRRGECDAALHYSRRSAELALQEAHRSGIVEAFVTLRHYCLSADAAAPLAAAFAGNLEIADHPDETSLLALLRQPA